jgi:O-antigen ligase
MTGKAASPARAEGIGPAARERAILSTLLIMILVAYPALGRDIAFNKANCAVCFSRDARADLSSYDTIGFFLPYLRVSICGLAAFALWAGFGARWFASNIAWLFVPFALLALASVAWADTPAGTLRDAAMLFALWAALPPLICRLGPATAARVSLHLIAAVVIASCAVALAFPAIGRHTGEEVVQAVHAGRWRGIFGHKNGLGAWAAYGSVFLFTHSQWAGGPRAYWWVARAASAACLAFSGSSTGLIMAASLGYAWTFLRALRRIGLWPALGLFAFTTASLGLLAYAFLDDIFDWVGRDATFSGRTLLWQIIASYFAEASLPVQLFGGGYQSGGGVELSYILENRFNQPMSPEDSYLSLLLDLGVAGLLAFFVPYCLAIANAFAWLKHAGPRDRAALEFFLMTMFTVLVAGFTEATAMVATSYDGILGFGALLALMSLPRAPATARNRESRRRETYVSPPEAASRPGHGA